MLLIIGPTIENIGQYSSFSGSVYLTNAKLSCPQLLHVSHELGTFPTPSYRTHAASLVSLSCM